MDFRYLEGSYRGVFNSSEMGFKSILRSSNKKSIFLYWSKEHPLCLQKELGSVPEEWPYPTLSVFELQRSKIYQILSTMWDKVIGLVNFHWSQEHSQEWFYQCYSCQEGWEFWKYRNLSYHKKIINDIFTTNIYKKKYSGIK